MYQIAEFFNRPPNMYGFFIGGVDWSVYLDDTYFVYGLGGNYGDPNSNQLTLNAAQQKQAMNWLGKLSKVNPPRLQNENVFDGDQLEQNGEVRVDHDVLFVWKAFEH